MQRMWKEVVYSIPCPVKQMKYLPKRRMVVYLEDIDCKVNLELERKIFLEGISLEWKFPFYLKTLNLLLLQINLS